MPATPNRDLELFMKLLENKLAEVCLDNPIKQMEVEILTCPERVQQLSFFEPRVSDKSKLDRLVSVFNQTSITTGFLKPKDEILPEEAWEVTPEFEEFEPIEDQVEINGQSFQIRPAYSTSLSQAPRPSRLLKKPLRLERAQMDRYQLLNQHPIERLEDGWWETSRGRDYYFAISPKGEFVWIYHDRIEDAHYLHGFFD
jgi:hypothetical protein